MSKKETREENAEKTILDIIENYRNLEKSIVSQLLLNTPNHYPTTGTYREAVWKDLFEQIIPRKFCIAQGVFIIDSNKKISREVDLAIYDEQYTPYIFNYGKIKFIPIEAVVVVIQCKSKNLNGIKEWVYSISELRTSSCSIARLFTGVVDNDLQNAFDKWQESKADRDKKSQTSSRPIRILCSAQKDSITKSICNQFDVIITISNEDTLKITMSTQNTSYGYWYEQLNHYNTSYPQLIHSVHQSIKEKKLDDLGVKDKNGENLSLISLIFQLNQMLMLINNPMLFPHQAYVEMFNDLLAKSEINETGGDCVDTGEK